MSRIVSVSLTDGEYDEIRAHQRGQKGFVADPSTFGFTAIFRRGLFALASKDDKIEVILQQQRKIENMTLILDRLSRRIGELENDVMVKQK